MDIGAIPNFNLTAISRIGAGDANGGQSNRGLAFGAQAGKNEQYTGLAGNNAELSGVYSNIYGKQNISNTIAIA